MAAVELDAGVTAMPLTLEALSISGSSSGRVPDGSIAQYTSTPLNPDDDMTRAQLPNPPSTPLRSRFAESLQLTGGLGEQEDRKAILHQLEGSGTRKTTLSCNETQTVSNFSQHRGSE